MGRLTKGMHRDTHPSDQPEGTWRYARNAIINRVDGAISNERGTDEGPNIGLLPGYKVIGAIETTSDEIVLFSVNRYQFMNPNTGELTNSPHYGRSEIGLITSNNEYRTALNLPLGDPENDNWADFLNNGYINAKGVNIDLDLKFNASYPITGTYKINAKGELIVYWTDNLNPPRTINLTRQMEVYEPSLLYANKWFDSTNPNYVDLLNLFTHSGPVPNINLHSVTSGGALVTGTYQLALAYVDVDLTVTNYIVVDNPVSIVEDVESVTPIERYDGASAGSQSGKSIRWRVNNINDCYKFLRPVVIQTIEDQRFAFQLHDIEVGFSNIEPGVQQIGNNQIVNITFSGTEGYISTSVEDVIIDEVSYDTVKTITQLDDVLYLGNLTGTKDIGFQPYAGNIKLTPTVRTITDFDPYSLITDNIENGFIEVEPLNASKANGYRDPWNCYKMKGYMRGEVYAFYIAFILNDGSMSYAYHIPGREAILDEKEDVESGDSDFQGADSAEISTLGNVKNFHVKSYSQEAGANNMNFWENENEYYPSTQAFSNPVYKDENGKPSRVRHHHFPKNSHPEFAAVSDTFVSGMSTATPESPNVKITFDDIAITDADIYSLGLTWIDEQGDVIPDSMMAAMTAFHVDDMPTVIEVGQMYNVTWDMADWATGGGTYEGLVVSVQEDNDWILISHEQYYIDSGIPNWAGGGLVDAIGSWFAEQFSSADYPNDTNVSNALGGAFGSGHMTPANSSLPSNCVTVTNGGTVSDTVQILGFDLSDIQIPGDIADKVQGFRIYHAKRDHKNKRILGQGPITPYNKQTGRLGGCPDDPREGVSSSQDFWVKTPLDIDEPKDSESPIMAFYNFELLRTQNSIAPATHISIQNITTHKVFLGPGVSHELDVDSACNFELIRSNFFISGQTTNLSSLTNYVIKERCKTFVEGNKVLTATAAGFGYRLYNRGGETHMALGFTKSISGLNSDTYNGIKTNKSDYSSVFLNNITTKVYTVNLEAFKTDVYSTIDSQNLVWTGFQVVGRDIQNFIINDEVEYDISAIPGYVGGYDTASVQTNSSEAGVYFNEVDEAPNGQYHPNIHGTAGNFKHGIFGGDTFLCRYGFRQTLDPRISTMDPRSRISAILSIIETTDNINFRHEEGKDTVYVPGSSFKEVAIQDRDGKGYDPSTYNDLTAQPSIKYNIDYSRVNDTRPAFALPNLISAPTSFSTRVQRSAKSDPGSLIDNFRVFLANDYKDMPKNRGALWNLATFNNLLYIHMEDSLLLTKGKQTMALKDGAEAFIGSGDIFAQDPDELLQTEEGYGGTNSQFCTLITKHGYFFVDKRNGKVFMASQKLVEISKNGMESWLKQNIDDEKWNYRLPDSPIIGTGFVSGWDEKNDRILLTKRGLLPTVEGKEFFEPYAGRANNRSDLQGKIIYNPTSKRFELKVYPAIERVENGDFAYGNQFLPITDFSDATDFSSSQPTTADFHFEIAEDAAPRSLSSGEFQMDYGVDDPHFSIMVDLEAHTQYQFKITWKGSKGIRVSMPNVLGNSNIFYTTTNQSAYTTTTVSFMTGNQTQYKLSIFGGIAAREGTLFVKSVSIKDSAFDAWEYNPGWEIKDKKITHTGASKSSLQQSLNEVFDKKVVTKFTISGATTGDLTVYYGDVEMTAVSNNGTYNIEKVWSSRDLNLKFVADGGFNGSLDNISSSTKALYNYKLYTPDGIIDTTNIVVKEEKETEEIPCVKIEVPVQVGVRLVSIKDESVEQPSRTADSNHPVQLWTRVGWTLSYYPESKTWGSFHDYLPHLYTYKSGAGNLSGLCSFFNWEELPIPFWEKTSHDYSSVEALGTHDVGDSGHFMLISTWGNIYSTPNVHSWKLWGHNSVYRPGCFYASLPEPNITFHNSVDETEMLQAYTNAFEVEGIINSQKQRDVSKVFSNISYESEVFDRSKKGDFRDVRYKRLDKDGFTSFFIYNSTQHSGDVELIYLTNIRKVAHKWQINKFRDMSSLYLTTFSDNSEYIESVDYAPAGVLTSGFEATQSGSILQLEDPDMAQGSVDWVGNQDVHDMFEATWQQNGSYGINTHDLYIDTRKPWHLQKKFADTYIGIRLTSNNLNQNFVNLYSLNAGMRKYIR